MTSALAVLLGALAAYCLMRAVVPAWRPHGAAVEVWHLVMATAMVAMLVLPVRRDTAVLQLLVFSLGLGWCLAHLVASSARLPHLRLGAGFVAMLVMLVPTVFASAASAASGGMSGMPGMHESHAGAPAWLSVALFAVMAWSCWPGLVSPGPIRRRRGQAGKGIPVVEWQR